MKHLKFPKNLTKGEKKLTSNRTLARNKNITIPLVAIKNVRGNQTDVTLSLKIIERTSSQNLVHIRKKNKKQPNNQTNKKNPT